MPSIPSISAEDLRRLSSGRWLIGILAITAEQGGSRFSVLARRLSMSNSVLSRSIDRLEQLGLIARNAGHGHPLRPEYILTERGRNLGDWARTVVNEQKRLEIPARTLGRWSLPVLAQLHQAPKRFSALQRELSPVTPRALSLELSALRSVRLVDHRPESLLYSLAARARPLGALTAVY